jgi:hypothetical protein
LGEFFCHDATVRQQFPDELHARLMPPPAFQVLIAMREDYAQLATFQEAIPPFFTIPCV